MALATYHRVAYGYYKNNIDFFLGLLFFYKGFQVLEDKHKREPGENPGRARRCDRGRIPR